MTTNTSKTDYAPIPKSSPFITPPKGYSDDRSISEKFSGLIKSQAGKAAEPVEKPKRIKDPKAIAECRAWNRCQKCEKSPRTNKNVKLHVHHIRPKAAGGGDEPTNLCLLCTVCHQNAHQIGNPSRAWMLDAAILRIRRQRVSLSAFGVEKRIQEQNATSGLESRSGNSRGAV